MKWSNCYLGHDPECELCKIAVRELTEISESVKLTMRMQDLDALKDQLHKTLPIWREYDLQFKYPEFIQAVDLIKSAESWSELIKLKVELCAATLEISQTLILRGS